MIEPKVIVKKLTELFQRLINQPMLPRGQEWKDDWPSWERNVTWHPDVNGVYILWANDRGLAENNQPIYIGEGLLGSRIWKSFKARTNWQFAQLITDDLISSESRECKFWRKALERFGILALDPLENRD